MRKVLLLGIMIPGLLTAAEQFPCRSTAVPFEDIDTIIDVYTTVKNIIIKDKPLSYEDIDNLNLYLPRLGDPAVEKLAGYLSDDKRFDIRVLLRWHHYIEHNFTDMTNFPLLRLFASTNSGCAQYMLADYYFANGAFERAAHWVVKAARYTSYPLAKHRMRKMGLMKYIRNKTYEDSEIEKMFVDVSLEYLKERGYMK